MPGRDFRWGDLHVCVDASGQVLRLELDDVALWHEIQHLPLSYIETGGVPLLDYNPGVRYDAPLFPSVAALPAEESFMSAAMLAQKAKSVDDSIVATLERLVDEGTFSLIGRSALIEGLLGQLNEKWVAAPGDKDQASAIGLLMAAQSLARADEEIGSIGGPAELRLARSRWLRAFRENQAADVPLGVYSWSARLTGLYRQGRALQAPLSDSVAAVLAGALTADDALRKAYETHLELCSVTNPLVGANVLSGAGSEAGRGEQACLFPPSDSVEGRLLKRLVGFNPVPPDFDLIGELIQRVSDGRVSLSTTRSSGWYDHVAYALEVLLLPDRAPEAAKLELAENYREDLRQLFRSLLGSARESHVKQLESLAAGGKPLIIWPHLTVEPLAEYYRRRAQSYRFLREKLVEVLGEDALRSPMRLTSHGETDVPLLEEMLFMEQLFAGAAAIVRDELGIEGDSKPDEKQQAMTSKAVARSWISSHRNDPDLAEDVRMMVPVFRDIGRNEFHVLATVGYEQRKLKASFVDRPAVAVRDRLGRVVDRDIVWSAASYLLARPVTINCRVKKLLDREQFRALCDREKTVPAIRSALEQR